MTTYPCGCDDDEHMPCEAHMDVIVAREGASLRTGDELGVQFIHDCSSNFQASVLSTEDAQLFHDIEEALDEARDSRSGTAWLEDDDLREALHDLQRDVEARLPEGTYVLWDDGYLIYQFAGGPLLADLCEGHESLAGAHMGETVYCDGSCRR